jgi:hypothetical protein
MVYKFLQKQTDRPFLKRYLKRDEILRQIATCDASLSDSVNAFSVSLPPPLYDNSFIGADDFIYADIHPNPYFETSPSSQFTYDLQFDCRCGAPCSACIHHPRRNRTTTRRQDPHLPHLADDPPARPLHPGRDPRETARPPRERERAGRRARSRRPAPADARCAADE